MEIIFPGDIDSTHRDLNANTYGRRCRGCLGTEGRLDHPERPTCPFPDPTGPSPLPYPSEDTIIECCRQGVRDGVADIGPLPIFR